MRHFAKTSVEWSSLFHAVIMRAIVTNVTEHNARSNLGLGRTRWTISTSSLAQAIPRIAGVFIATQELVPVLASKA